MSFDRSSTKGKNILLELPPGYLRFKCGFYAAGKYRSDWLQWPQPWLYFLSLGARGGYERDYVQVFARPRRLGRRGKFYYPWGPSGFGPSKICSTHVRDATPIDRIQYIFGTSWSLGRGSSYVTRWPREAQRFYEGRELLETALNRTTPDQILRWHWVPIPNISPSHSWTALTKHVERYGKLHLIRAEQ